MFYILILIFLKKKLHSCSKANVLKIRQFQFASIFTYNDSSRTVKRKTGISFVIFIFSANAMEFSKLKPILAPTSSLHARFHVMNSSSSRLYELFIRNYIIKNVCPNPTRKMCRRTHRVHLKCSVK